MHPSTESQFREALVSMSPKLTRIARQLLSDQLRARMGGSDVAQEVLAEAFRRRHAYLSDGAVGVDVWLIRLLRDRLIDLHRRHVVAQRRSVLREHTRSGSAITKLAEHFVCQTREADGVAETDRRDFLELALESLGDRDREILVLRHFDDLSNGEAAERLGISAEAAKKRHGRALLRLQERLHALNISSVE